MRWKTMERGDYSMQTTEDWGSKCTHGKEIWIHANNPKEINRGNTPLAT